jgi:hypothetical protein
MSGKGTTSSRRRFLGSAAGATGVAIGAALGASRAAGAIAPDELNHGQPAAIGPRAYVASHFALELDTNPPEIVQDAQGGGFKADVIEFQQGNSSLIQKQLGTVAFNDIDVQIGLPQATPLLDWVAATWSKNYQRKNGAVVATDFNYEKKARREFFNALIGDVTIPTLDGSSKDAGYLTVTVAPEQIAHKVDSGKLQSATTSKQKLWMSANFRLELDGVDTTKVSKIDSFTVKQQIVEFREGEQRLPQRVPGKLEFPNLAVTFASASGPSWLSWFEDFVVNGINGDDNEKGGRIVFLAPNLKDELGSIDLFHVGIFQLDDGVFDPVNEPSALMRAYLYVERMKLNVAPAGVPQPTPTPAP